VGLARAIDLEVVDAVAVALQTPRPATYLGTGKVEELAGVIKARSIALVVVDCALSPVQQRNLEKAWGTKVIDRTGLILEIFGQRAKTKEGALQVELAHLTYQKSRLVRSWTHLERQRGGFGFLGGPGETQIETDRRLIQDRIRRIEAALDDVRRTRGLHRAGRKRVPFPSVAIVGYTNAGKSTLFNRLTRAEVLAKDMLFATLDPTARVIRLPKGLKVVLSDTVGFISDLPTMLVAAFRATLEDVLDADIILHVRDVSHPDTEAQREDVDRVLGGLGLESGPDHVRIEVLNKIDLLDEDRRRAMERNVATASKSEVRAIAVSAATGENMDALTQAIETHFARLRPSYVVELDSADGRGLNWLYETCELLERRATDSGKIIAVVRVAPERSGELERRFPRARGRGA
jgi:GTP-binding protein HflX